MVSILSGIVTGFLCLLGKALVQAMTSRQEIREKIEKVYTEHIAVPSTCGCAHFTHIPCRTIVDDLLDLLPPEPDIDGLENIFRRFEVYASEREHACPNPSNCECTTSDEFELQKFKRTLMAWAKGGANCDHKCYVLRGSVVGSNSSFVLTQLTEDLCARCRVKRTE